ncbi:MAG: hypothetical protein SOZ80_00985 [Prevotella sp.]|uniref:hypothetical protein n=1 Tax=Prevotella sp. TaxID=59823 RepID=UPI002A32C498|nr:hypothetical protein [Prevotella sp.]MDD7318699.1 hypothetical protein [Prevotellaceae bacterium]MDY4019342.1 hypothetical protein [Prevotella sp.]
MEKNNTMTTIPPMPSQYKTLKDISARKQQLLTGIRADRSKMGTLWNDLTTKREHSTKGLKMADVLNTGAGIFDGAMLGWKLYRKYNGVMNKFVKKNK